MAQEVRGYVEAILNSLAADVLKVFTHSMISIIKSIQLSCWLLLWQYIPNFKKINCSFLQPDNPLGSEVVDGPLASLRFPTSSDVNWTTPSHLVDLDPPMFIGTLEASTNGYVTKLCKYPLPPSLGYVVKKLDNLELLHLKTKEVESATVCNIIFFIYLFVLMFLHIHIYLCV